MAAEQHPNIGTLWPRPAQLAAAFLLGIGSTLLAVRLLGSPPRPLEFRPAAFDLNRADRAQLLQLPGVGPALADRITSVRDERGGFDSPDDLRSVPGFGPGRFERIRSLIRADASPPSMPPREPTKHPTEPVDINVASVGELEKLPGIGPKTAQRIVDERGRKPFASVDDLRGRVAGIGPRTLEKLRPYVTVTPKNSN